MERINLNNVAAFVVVARERSFTRAAAQLGLSQSSLSHTISALEAKLGMRLLTRTTRGVSPTEAGERLLATVGPYCEGIEAELASLSEDRDKPAATLTISSHAHAVRTILWPKLSKLLPAYPDLRVEFSIHYGLIDIVAERFDAGVRVGDQVAKDMIAMRISPDFNMTVVGSPSYFCARKVPVVPQDLTEHSCINLRLPTHGGLYAWEFEKDGQEMSVHVQGQVILNTSAELLTAALEGYGLAYVPQDVADKHIATGELMQVLDDWRPTYPGYHLYYPSRRNASPAFLLVLEALRLRP
jgi:DNA-binding transcriptional LysR family regulator